MDKYEASRRRTALRERAVRYMGGRCAICSYAACLSAFDFHHVAPLAKDFTISRKMTSFDAIKDELDKCVLLCCRCHREVHAGLHPRFLDTWDDDRQGLEFDEADLEDSHSD